MYQIIGEKKATIFAKNNIILSEEFTQKNTFVKFIDNLISLLENSNVLSPYKATLVDLLGSRKHIITPILTESHIGALYKMWFWSELR